VVEVMSREVARGDRAKGGFLTFVRARTARTYAYASRCCMRRIERGTAYETYRTRRPRGPTHSPKIQLFLDEGDQSIIDRKLLHQPRSTSTLGRSGHGDATDIQD